jgi:NADPH:quinone reductase-like Zn-dependent oxidoreductase
MALPATYRAVSYASTSGGFVNNLNITSSPMLKVPETGSNSKPCVLIKVHAAALNPADYKIPIGPFGRLLISRPATPGLDFSGTIAAFPTNSTPEQLGIPGLKVGDQVFGRLDWPYQHGTLGEYTLVVPNGITKLPEGVKFSDAAGVGTAAISAWQVLQPYVRQGDRVFINGGSGGVGLYAIQIAKLLGASHVTVTCSAANAELVKEVGADEVIDYRSVDVVAELKSKAASSEQKYDHLVDNIVRGSKIYEESAHFLREGGAYVQVVVHLDTLDDIKSLLSRALLPSILGGGKRKWVFFMAKNDQKALDQIGAWAGEGKLKLVHDSEYSLENVKSAFNRLDTGRARGKVIVTIAE